MAVRAVLTGNIDVLDRYLRLIARLRQPAVSARETSSDNFLMVYDTVKEVQANRSRLVKDRSEIWPAVTGLRMAAAYATLLGTSHVVDCQQLMGKLKPAIAPKSRLSCFFVGNLHSLTANARTFA